VASDTYISTFAKGTNAETAHSSHAGEITAVTAVYGVWDRQTKTMNGLYPTSADAVTAVKTFLGSCSHLDGRLAVVTLPV